MDLASFTPTAAEVTERREKTGDGYAGTVKQLTQERVIEYLIANPINNRDIRDILIALIKGKL